MLCGKTVPLQPLINRNTGIPLPFTPSELHQLKTHFNQISKGTGALDRKSFSQNMGVLGLQTAQMLSDRVFCSFDMDGDQIINFNDFAEYIDILRHGTPMEKALISFRMIDIKKRGFFSDKDFKEFMIEFLRSWSAITNAQITNQVLNRTNGYIKTMFEQRPVVKSIGRVVDFDYYFKNIYRDNQLILAFDWITKGVSNQFMKSQTDNQVRLERQIIRLSDQLDNIYNDMYPLVPKGIQFGGGFPVSINGMTYIEPTSQTMSTEPLIGSKTTKQRLKLLVDQVSGIKKQIQSEYMKNVNAQKQMKTRSNTIMNVHKKLTNKEGKMLLVGDTNWNLILNMMIGLQMAVRSIKSYQQIINEDPLDFRLKYYFELVPRRFGGDKYLNQVQICKFTDYAPNTFNHIRKIFNIDNEQYIKSIGPDKVLASLLVGQVSSMSELMSQGKSGSFFYYTADGQYMLKTISREQFVFLRSILFDYYYHLVKNPNSFITKFFGLHKLVQRGPNGENIRSHYFVIMSNIFNTQQKIVERYDLKGAFFARVSTDIDPAATKKDVNFLHRPPLTIHAIDRQQLLSILQKDLNFLCDHNIVDYSMLIGVVHKNPLIKQNYDNPMMKIYDSIQLNERYVIGVIDILTFYGFRKKLQYCLKSCFCGSSVSIVPPRVYAQRMFQFLTQRVFR